MYQVLVVLFGFAFVYSLVAERLARTPLADALVFTAFGVLVGRAGLDIIDIPVTAEGLRILAELTLALVLFTDAAGVKIGVLRRFAGIPERLLLVGMPLTILLGIGAGALLLPQVGWLGWALLAVMLAPTDAALGRAVVTNPAVPVEVRQGLNVESGLNDGICVPLLLFVLEAAKLTEDAPGLGALLEHLHFASKIGIGCLVGAGLGFAALHAIRFAGRRGWIGESWRQVTVATLAFTIMGAAEMLGGSGFIACFVGGLVAGALARRGKHEFLVGAEGTANIFSLLTWVVFGIAAAGGAIDRLTWPIVAYGVLSLTLLRMLPVWLAMRATGMDPAERLFMGWFGPRGLASLVFGVLVLDAQLPSGETLITAVAWTVLLSVVAHGLTAAPLAAWLGRREGGGR